MKKPKKPDGQIDRQNESKLLPNLLKNHTLWIRIQMH